MTRNRFLLVGLAVALLGACAPRLVLEPTVPLPLPQVGVPQWVLPGNPLPHVDDFESYPLGAVLTTVAPKRYGLLGTNEARFTVTEALNPQNAITRAVRLERFGGALLTTGAGDWTNYLARLEVKSLGGCYWCSLLLRVFLDPTGTRALEFRFGGDGVELTKVLGEQRQVVAKRPELKEAGQRFVEDKQWHRFAILAKDTGEVRFSMDGGELLSWKDPDFRQGGLGFGVHEAGLVLYLDNLEVTPLSEPPKAP
ncbi:hypothetical protein [Thermus neutrinimicus]|uniref:hypothetical protein n=1 Tax=Thermus neutrinimicus TaxID=2908149 RepID=UPI001FA99835|nr:hypothetical protein [Thermus neutrinimicus]